MMIPSHPMKVNSKSLTLMSFQLDLRARSANLNSKEKTVTISKKNKSCYSRHKVDPLIISASFSSQKMNNYCDSIKKRKNLLDKLGKLPEATVENKEWLYMLEEDTRHSLSISQRLALRDRRIFCDRGRIKSRITR